MKRIVLIFLLLMPFALAETTDESFTIPVEIRTGDYYANVTIGNTINSYSCNSTTTNTFNPTIHRNFTYTCDTDVKNFTTSVNLMADTCKVIQDAYKDSSTYYKQYVDCVSKLASCEKERDIYKNEATLKNSAVSEKDNLNRQLLEMTRSKDEFEVYSGYLNTTLTSCQTQFDSCSGTKWLFGAIGIAIGAGGLYLWNKKKESKSPVSSEMPK